MQPNYVAKKSAWRAVTFWRVVFFWLILPLIVMIVGIIAAKKETLEFYDNKIIRKSGIISRNEAEFVFSGVVTVSVKQSLFGRIFNYGDVYVNARGPWDIDTKGISNPMEFKKFLQSNIVDANSINYVEYS